MQKPDEMVWISPKNPGRSLKNVKKFFSKGNTGLTLLKEPCLHPADLSSVKGGKRTKGGKKGRGGGG